MFDFEFFEKLKQVDDMMSGENEANKEQDNQKTSSDSLYSNPGLYQAFMSKYVPLRNFAT